MRQETINLYTFEELSEDAQKKVMEDLWDINVHYEWWDYTVDHCKESAALMGIDVDNIYFSGFSSQGDGACFIGSYDYKKDSVKSVTDYCGGNDKDLIDIAKQLQAIQRRNFYQLSAAVSHSGRYNHEYCTTISVFRDGEYCTNDDTCEELSDILRDFMRWIYSRLESEYDCLTSEEAVKESIIVNEYEFTKEGVIQ